MTAYGASGARIAGSSRPHRAYRRLPKTWRNYASSLLVLVASELIVLFLVLPWLAPHFFDFITGVLQTYGIPVTAGEDKFLYLTVRPPVFVTMPVTYMTAIVWATVCALGIIVFSLWKTIDAPLRYLINTNFLILLASALFVLFNGHMGYDGYPFTLLMERTALITWMVIPLLMVFLTFLMPFKWTEQVALIGVTLVSSVILSAARYIIFVEILARWSIVPQADLYLMFGPLLDALQSIALYSLFAVRLARRLRLDKDLWTWL